MTNCHLEIAQDWTDSQCETFQTILAVFDLNVFLVKSVQVLIFSFLAFLLISHSCKGNKSIGRLQIVTALLTVFQGIAAIVRTWAEFPIYSSKPKMKIYGVAIFADDVSFYSAVWLFSAMLYESALDIESLLGKSNRQDTKKVKRNFNIARVAGAGLIIFSHLPVLIPIFHIKISKETHQILAGTSLGLLSVIVAGTAIFMTLAVQKLSKVAKIAFDSGLNPWLTTLYIFSSFVWALAWFIFLVLFLIYIDDIDSYTPLLALLTLYQITVNSVAVIFGIMALIIFRSS